MGFYCDKCQALISDKDMIWKITQSNDQTSGTYSNDLCAKCRNAFQLWMKEKPAIFKKENIEVSLTPPVNTLPYCQELGYIHAEKEKE